MMAPVKSHNAAGVPLVLLLVVSSLLLLLATPPVAAAAAAVAVEDGEPNPSPCVTCRSRDAHPSAAGGAIFASRGRLPLP